MRMAGSSNPAGGGLRRGGEAAAPEPGPDGSVGSSVVHRYVPMCILWPVVLWLNAYVFVRFGLWLALLFFLFHTVALALLLHLPDLLEFLDRPAAPQEEEEEGVIVHPDDAKVA